MLDARLVTLQRKAVLAVIGSVMVLIGVGQASAQADVAAVKGSAYGYQCMVSLGNDVTCSPTGPTPSVTLASNASNSPRTATAASARADTGPATIFSSGALNVSTQGTLGAGGSVTSSTNIQRVNASGQEVFTASNLVSTCTATETGVSGSTTITGGTLQIDQGDNDGTNSIPDHPEQTVPLPTNPAPNTTYEGHVHIGNTTDNFRYVYNEQTVDADGSITVNAAHEYILGPFAKGDLIVGRAACGATSGVFKVVEDRTPPVLTLGGRRTQTLRATVPVRVSCPVEACRATAGGTVRVPLIGFGRVKRFKLKSASGRIPRGGSATLRPRLSRAARRAIRRALRRGRRIRVKLKVVATDKSGIKTTRARRVRLRL